MERQRIYEEVRKLRVAQPDIDVPPLRRRLGLEFDILPSRMTLRRWLKGTTSPTTAMNKFQPLPSPELSFFMGAWVGDGWADENDGGRRLRLKVRSRSFAEEFARCGSVILEKKEPYRVWTTRDEGGVCCSTSS